jgi:hypothetical protein
MVDRIAGGVGGRNAGASYCVVRIIMVAGCNCAVFDMSSLVRPVAALVIRSL